MDERNEKKRFKLKSWAYFTNNYMRQYIKHALKLLSHYDFGELPWRRSLSSILNV